MMPDLDFAAATASVFRLHEAAFRLHLVSATQTDDLLEVVFQGYNAPGTLYGLRLRVPVTVGDDRWREVVTPPQLRAPLPVAANPPQSDDIEEWATIALVIRALELYDMESETNVPPRRTGFIG
ncbi:hypothetical protein [Cryobacterium ruanii]|uniref:Uncharacterized protein n=1 Tax=Cryobacterium ruanii TaxID=1259197 RepID=A0A4R9APQ6_9MICO|nr:hypothetical protein [Cryobacterium ruanii]TFD67758.1 hypothetical protein E3T47_03820 [Cryobacterium ruanii]